MCYYIWNVTKTRCQKVLTSSFIGTACRIIIIHHGTCLHCEPRIFCVGVAVYLPRGQLITVTMQKLRRYFLHYIVDHA